MASSRPEPRSIHVFIASPGDLAVERRAFKDVIDDLNAGFGDGAGVRFVALGWEDTLAATGRRAQGVINQDIDRSDVFVLALHRRWGQEAPDAKPYTSYTEEEFHRAMDRWKKSGAPEIFVFFKHVDPHSIADPGPQLQKVLAFPSPSRIPGKCSIASSRMKRRSRPRWTGTCGPTPGAISPRPTRRARRWSCRSSTSRQSRRPRPRSKRPSSARRRIIKHAETQAARADKLALTLAEQAAAAALEGHIEEARQTFAKAHESTTNLSVLSLAFGFYHRTGDLKAAEDMLERWLAISGREAETGDTAAAYGNLGIIYKTRGDFDCGEEMYKRALATFEKLGHQEGMAAGYGNLGLIYQTRGELDRAEEMHKKALAIGEKLGHQEGMANHYCNLGNLYQTRGELDRAEEMHKKALAIEEKLGRQEGMARQCGNLGNIYWTRGDLDRAEAMFKKSLAIFEKLGHQEGMANHYCNLGNLYQARGELDRAEEMHKKSLAVDEEIGRQEGMARQYGNLGNIYRTRGELDRAEEMHTKALAIEEKLGRQEGMATTYGDLGLLYRTRGELDRAEEMLKKSLALFKAVGAAPQVEQVQAWLDSLNESRAER